MELNFNATAVEPASGAPDAIPSGWYNAAIDSTEMKATKDGLGAYLELRFNVLDGAHVNHKLFARLNLRNANPVAVNIAYGELSAICHAVGVLQVQDSTQLHGLPMKVKVKKTEASGDYEAGNDIKAYKNINAEVPATPAAPGAPAAPVAPVAPPAAAAAPVASTQPWGGAAPAPVAAAPAPVAPAAPVAAPAPVAPPVPAPAAPAAPAAAPAPPVVAPVPAVAPAAAPVAAPAAAPAPAWAVPPVA